MKRSVLGFLFLLLLVSDHVVQAVQLMDTTDEMSTILSKVDDTLQILNEEMQLVQAEEGQSTLGNELHFRELLESVHHHQSLSGVSADIALQAQLIPLAGLFQNSSIFYYVCLHIWIHIYILTFISSCLYLCLYPLWLVVPPLNLCLLHCVIALAVPAAISGIIGIVLQLLKILIYIARPLWKWIIIQMTQKLIFTAKKNMCTMMLDVYKQIFLSTAPMVSILSAALQARIKLPPEVTTPIPTNIKLAKGQKSPNLKQKQEQEKAKKLEAERKKKEALLDADLPIVKSLYRVLRTMLRISAGNSLTVALGSVVDQCADVRAFSYKVSTPDASKPAPVLLDPVLLGELKGYLAGFVYSMRPTADDIKEIKAAPRRMCSLWILITA